MSKTLSNTKTLPSTPNFPQMEQEVTQLWRDTDAFKKQVEQRDSQKNYVFYDGPPFATGMPHYGHLLGSTSKDVVPRYWAMRGYQVKRTWGWDCHGLPIENMIEGQLDIKGGKKGIEDLGIDVFNQACRTEVMRLDSEWEHIIERLGRWVDFKNNYKTMDTNYMESVWWGFAQLYKKGLVYQGKKIVMYCPRCATPLSNFEIAMDNSYKDVEDWSIYVKFAVEHAGAKPAHEPTKNEFLLAWTTTPWTLPGNVGLAVNPEAEYAQVAANDELLWLASDLVAAVFKDTPHQVKKTVLGSTLVGMRYTPLYSYLEPERTKSAWSVLPADFVSLESGTGIVHTAAVFGEDDFALAQEYDLPLASTLDEGGMFLEKVTVAQQKFYKKAEELINADLTNRGLVFRLEKMTHSYPFCYRCDTPLYYNAVPAWFIAVATLRDKLIEHNKQMNWFPEHLKEGRFGNGLATAPDWNISRSRYWGTPMPIWEHAKSGTIRVIESIADLTTWAVDPAQVAELTDIHREHIDHIELWVDDAKTLKGQRIPEVFDCWVESGSMPFAQLHYPFENKQEFEQSYPAQFVSEYIAQTRAWFYCMHVLSVGIFDQHAVDNLLTTGTILAKDGSKMSKSKKNYPDPMKLIDEHGADSLRLYLMSSPLMKAENLSFNEDEVADIRKRVFVIWYNMYAFYHLYKDGYEFVPGSRVQSDDVMDRWILSRLHSTIAATTKYMDNYDLVRASRLLIAFVDELSTWYLRRSRDRLRDTQQPVQQDSTAVFGYVLFTLAQLFAPFTPFFSEWLYQQLVSEQQQKTLGVGSIHHTDWPEADSSRIDPELEEHMAAVRRSVEKAHAARSAAGIKVRQPLEQLTVWVNASAPKQNLLDVLADEVNVKTVVWQHSPEAERVELETALTPELSAEGEARELMRQIQKLRKKAGLSFEQTARATAPKWPAAWQQEIEHKTNTRLVQGETLELNAHSD